MNFVFLNTGPVDCRLASLSRNGEDLYYSVAHSPTLPFACAPPGVSAPHRICLRAPRERLRAPCGEYDCEGPPLANYVFVHPSPTCCGRYRGREPRRASKGVGQRTGSAVSQRSSTRMEGNTNRERARQREAAPCHGGDVRTVRTNVRRFSTSVLR